MADSRDLDRRALLRTGGLLPLLLASGSAGARAAAPGNGEHRRSLRGVALAGLEFGDALPGREGTDYVAPTTAELDMYKSRGITLVKIDFLWDRIQPRLAGGLEPTYLRHVTTLLGACSARGMAAVPSLYMAYGGERYGTLLQQGAITAAQFADVWARLTPVLKEHRCWAYGLLNEPNKWASGAGGWYGFANAAIAAIRAVDRETRIACQGYSWGTAAQWTANNPAIHRAVTDPAGNIVWEAHQYFDQDMSGTYKSSYDAMGAYPAIGVDRVRPFLDWLRQNRQRGFLGEYGVPNTDARWEIVLADFLAALKAADVPGVYFAGGPWWSKGSIGCELGGAAGPQIPVMARYA